MSPARVAACASLIGCAALLVLVPARRGTAAEPTAEAATDLKSAGEQWRRTAKSPAATKVKRAAQQAKPTHVIVHAEYKAEKDRAAAVAKFAVAEAVHQYDRFVTALIPLDEPQIDKAFAEVEMAAGFVWLNVDETVSPPPPAPKKVAVQSKAGGEEIARGGANGRTGKGVVIAVFDTGVDFRHPDFIRTGTDGKPESRFVAVWDTTRPFEKGVGQAAPIRYGKGESVGTVFTREHLTADLRGATPIAGNFDADGHGTACAGLAAGTGAALKAAQQADGASKDLKGLDYRGVAPDADLIAVRLNHEEATGLYNAWVLNAACDWVDKLAGPQPAVISCSYGGHLGGHDGSQVDERWLSAWLDQRPADGPARLVFIAAGNEAEDGTHAAAEFKAGTPGRITWTLAKGNKAFLQVYVDAVGEPTAVKDVTLKLGPGSDGKVGKGVLDPLNGSAVFQVEADSSGSLNFSTTGRATFRADAYLFAEHGDVFVVGKENARQVGSPASAVAAFAVGSYDFNPDFLAEKGFETVPRMTVGDISAYSNAGSLRKSATKGVVKPDFASPGNLHTAAVPLATPNKVKGRGDLEQTTKYQAFNGTSAATPYAAGVAALVLEANPKLSAEGYRGLLAKALTKPNGREVPDPVWGRGKLDLAAVKKLVPAK
jgi:subtilisin family serine protease